MSKAAVIALSAVAAASLAMFIRHRQRSTSAASSAPSRSLPSKPSEHHHSHILQPVTASAAAFEAPAASAAAHELPVDHLASFMRIRARRDEILRQQRQTPNSLLLAQSSAEWSRDADTCAADWRAGKSAGHTSAARALADMHACDDMCSVWAGGVEGWRLQTDIDCDGGRVRNDALAVQTYLLAEALGDADCQAHLQRLQQCPAAEPLLAFAAELRAQAPLTHHEAQHYLGTVLLHGTMGFAQDLDAAFALFGSAAAANFAPAQSSLVSDGRGSYLQRLAAAACLSLQFHDFAGADAGEGHRTAARQSEGLRAAGHCCCCRRRRRALFPGVCARYLARSIMSNVLTRHAYQIRVLLQS